MYHIKLTDYVPEPNPVKSNYIVCAHYYAAWKKGAAEIHNGFDDIHDYPERTPLAGYYDEEDSSYTDWEIKWAVEHGINCFIYCWYRYKDNVGKPVTPRSLRCGHGIHESLLNARYADYMKFAIMYEASPRWGATTPEDMMDNLMPFWMENYFKSGKYLIVDNKPVLFVYAWEQFTSGFSSVEEQRQVFEQCRNYCRQHGFDGMIFAAEERSGEKDKLTQALAGGYDFCFAYCFPGPTRDFPPEEETISQISRFYSQQIAETDGRYIPTASCFWDPEPRTTQHWIDYGLDYRKISNFWYVSPDGFRKMLQDCMRMADALPETNPGKNMIMIDNWNEWDEGHYVAPSHRFGFQYLQAIREELTERDNLPDYRMPQDLGLSDFNHHWDTPDFAEVCKKRFGLGGDCT